MCYKCCYLLSKLLEVRCELGFALADMCSRMFDVASTIGNPPCKLDSLFSIVTHRGQGQGRVHKPAYSDACNTCFQLILFTIFSHH